MGGERHLQWLRPLKPPQPHPSRYSPCRHVWALAECAKVGFAGGETAVSLEGPEKANVEDLAVVARTRVRGVGMGPTYASLAPGAIPGESAQILGPRVQRRLQLVPAAPGQSRRPVPAPSVSSRAPGPTPRCARWDPPTQNSPGSLTQG